MTEIDDAGDGKLGRREVIRLGGQLATTVGALYLSDGLLTVPAHAVTRPAAEGGTVVEVREGTNLCAALSPDGRSIAFDALNAIWIVPTAGGRAHRLTDDFQDATQARWSPDGRRLIFQSFREGVYDLWTVNPDGSGLTRLTDGSSYDLEPRFSPDGRLVAFASDRGGASHIWLLDPATGDLRKITDGEHKHASPVWSPDGRQVAYVVDDTVIEAVQTSSGSRRALVTASGEETLYAPSFSPDGRSVAYVRLIGAQADLVVAGKAVTTDEDVFPFAPEWLSADELLYTANGRIRRRLLSGSVRDVPFVAAVTIPARAALPRRPEPVPGEQVQGIASPVLSPDGSKVAFRALNALWILPVGGKPQRIVGDGYFTTDPDWSPDGNTLVYVSDRAGTANLWTYEVAGGRSERLTDLPDAQLSPRWSPDGRRIAYQDQSGATWVLNIADKSVVKVVPSLFQPGRPTWSPDGTKLALAAVRPVSRRGSSGHNQILTVDLNTHEIRYQPVAPERSVSTRWDDGPVWTRDGRYLVVGLESLAWRVPVDTDGTICGPPQRLTGEVTDSLSVSADSRTVLYLSNGRLRTVGIDGGTTRDVPVPLVRPVRPASAGDRPERIVIRPKALWDGRGERLRQDVDIVVEADRIRAVVPRGSAPEGRIVDAAALTVMPGLFDTHVHWYYRGRQWGDRQGRLWLAYGITTVRSPGDPAYQMVETREALEAGVRIGPRLYGTGEPLDGTRGYYGFMRTVSSRDQLERELDRAVALRYDIVKSYMRLPVSFEQRVVQRAHAQGIPVTSHYLYPAVRLGLDGMEHTGGGNRLGYSRTVSFGAGRAASDSIALWAAGGMWVSSTTIFADELYAEDRSLIEDERTRVLYPDWEYRRLLKKAEDAAGPQGEVHRVWNRGDADALLRLHQAGGLVVAGSDAAVDDPAIALHQNLRTMVKYGFTPREALGTAIGNASRALGLDDRLGAVTPGFLADLIFVRGNPLEDIKAAAAVEMVMLGGTLHTVPHLIKPFLPAAGKARAPRTRRLPAAPSALETKTDPYYWHDPHWASADCCSRH